MPRNFVLFILAISALTACNSVSKYAIDKNPVTKMDTNLLGIWKIIGDSDAKNYVLVQSAYDQFHEEENRFAKMPDAERIQWWPTLRGDSILYERDKKYVYYISYFNHHGTNPEYEEWGSYLSAIGKNNYFMNVGCLDKQPCDCYIGRLAKLNRTKDTLTVGLMADKRLQSLGSAGQVRQDITKHLNDPAYFSQAVRLYRVSHYHETFRGSVKVANK